MALPPRARLVAPYRSLERGNINQTVKNLAKANNKQKIKIVMDALWLCLHADDEELDLIEAFLKSKGYTND